LNSDRHNDPVNFSPPETSTARRQRHWLNAIAEKHNVARLIPQHPPAIFH